MSWIDEQLVARGIREARVLDAMRRMPRDAFVRRDLVCFAYDDRALAIGEGQTISQPYMVAATTEAQLHGIERVLDVGTGSGYQAAILGVLAREVIGIERVEALASRARETWRRLAIATSKSSSATAASATRPVLRMTALSSAPPHRVCPWRSGINLPMAAVSSFPVGAIRSPGAHGRHAPRRSIRRVAPRAMRVRATRG
jgi:protein-L-isoaspartate(D-aspartate) O-methyltransferase